MANGTVKSLSKQESKKALSHAEDVPLSLMRDKTSYRPFTTFLPSIKMTGMDEKSVGNNVYRATEIIHHMLCTVMHT